MSRVSFESVFSVQPDGRVSPKTFVQVGGIRMGPGVSFGRGAVFSGVEIAAYVGHELEIETLPDGTIRILGVY